MRRYFCGLAVAVWVLFGSTVTDARQQVASPDTLADAFEQAYLAWDDGDYIPALLGFMQVLSQPEGERFLERIALITGELYHVQQLAEDGRSVEFSPDGQWATYQTTRGGRVTTHLVEVGESLPRRIEIPSGVIAFSPTEPLVAYLELHPSEELIEARERAAEQRRVPQELRQQISWLEARDRRIVTRDLNGDGENVWDDLGLVKVALAFASDGQSLFIVGGPAERPVQADIYRVSLSEPESGPELEPERLTEGPGSKTSPIAAGDRYLVYQVAARNPLPQPPDFEDEEENEVEEVEGEETSQRVRSGIAVLDCDSGEVELFSGTGRTVSRDGSTLAFIASDEGQNTLRVVRLSDELAAATVVTTDDRLAAPALSADGSRVAYQRQPRYSWEIYLVDSDGENPQRLTREVQHDLRPQFLNDNQLLTLKGESRHRRSHLFDLQTDERRRLFHNNTVRTLVPEYDWAASPDGRHLLIVAQRDGDTISPQRGVYLVDVQRTVSRQQLVERLAACLVQEHELRQRGKAMFVPIEDQVHELVQQVSLTKLWEYQKALYDFDSKHITEPGNHQAIEYLEATFRSFGYQPQLQWFEPRDQRSANVIAVLPGTENPELVYVVSSHFDSVRRSPGADDNNSGTAMLLESARILARHPQPATIVFAALTAEESGLLGAREFVRRAVENDDRIMGVVNNDMIGFTRHYRLDNSIRYSNPGIRDVQHAGAFLFSDLITYDTRYYRGTDAAVFFGQYGDIIGGFGSYPILHSPHYHLPSDRLETVNQYLVRETTKANIATLMLLASSPSRLEGLEIASQNPGTVELQWNPSPETGVTGYEIVYGPPDDPTRHRSQVSQSNARLRADAGWHIAVRAIRDRGLHGWDWATTVVEPTSESNDED